MSGHRRIGVCLDTCHLVASGYDITSPSTYEHTFGEFGRIVGFDRLKVFHLNDSKKPLGSREAFAAAGANDQVELVDIKVEDLASVLLRFDNGAKGAFSVGQVCSGHKNDLRLEVCGSKAALAWKQEVQNELWIGNRDKANEILQKDPGLIDAEVRVYAHLPGGHQESWADAFCNLMRDIYGFIAAGKKPGDAHPPAFDAVSS